MFSQVSVSIGGSVIASQIQKYDVVSGLSVIFLFAESSKIGLALNPIKITCANCSTPIAEIVGGSIVIKSRHHGSQHVTAISIDDLNKAAQLK